MVKRSKSEHSLWLNKSNRQIHARFRKSFSQNLEEKSNFNITSGRIIFTLQLIQNKFPEISQNIALCLKILQSELFEQFFLTEKETQKALKRDSIRFIAILNSITSESISEELMIECINEIVEGKTYNVFFHIEH